MISVLLLLGLGLIAIGVFGISSESMSPVPNYKWVKAMLFLLVIGAILLSVVGAELIIRLV